MDAGGLLLGFAALFVLALPPGTSAGFRVHPALFLDVAPAANSTYVCREHH